MKFCPECGKSLWARTSETNDSDSSATATAIQSKEITAASQDSFEEIPNGEELREELYVFSVIPARYRHVPIWKTYGRYRKQMKRGYSKLLYNQRNKDETILSVIKRLFGEHITSRLVRTQNRELLSFRCIAYNIHRLTN